MRRLLIGGLLAVLSAVPTSAQNNNVLPSGSITAGGSDCSINARCVILELSNTLITSLTLQLSGTFSGTVIFESTSDANPSPGGNWYTITGVNEADGSAVTGATATGRFSFPNAGLTAIRVRCSAYTSGTISVTAVRGYAAANWRSPFFTRVDANKIEQRNGTNPQLFSVCNTYTSSTSFECAWLDWQSTANTFRLWTNKGSGGGSYRSIVIAAGISSNVTFGANEITTFGNGSGSSWIISASRHLTAATTNTFDIGTSTTVLAPRNIYAGTKIEAPTINATTALQVAGVPLTVPIVCSNTTASTAITTTATETFFDLNCAIAANTMIAGRIVTAYFGGVYSGNAADTAILRLKACQVQGCASGTVVTLATSPTYTLSAVTSQYWDLQAWANARTAGSSGTISVLAKNLMATTGLLSTTNTVPSTAASTWDSTVIQYLSLSVQFSSANAANSIQIQDLQVVIQ